MKYYVAQLATLSMLLIALSSLQHKPAIQSVRPAQIAEATAPVLENAEIPASIGNTITVAEGMQIWISSIEVQAPVVPVGLRADGSMDIPVDPSVVGWYALGAAPGNPGNVVLAGHLNAPGEVRGVFWNASTLQAGDEILVGERQETAKRYTIVDTSSYPFEEFPLELVFGAHTENMLRLITCDGAWDSARRMYNRRLVISAKEIPTHAPFLSDRSGS